MHHRMKPLGPTQVISTKNLTSSQNSQGQIDQETLLELTESYLKTLISEISNSLKANFDSFAPFMELGIDSFQILKIVKKLEEDFGVLPKTLLFENFNISDLSRYFVNKHDQTLSAKFAKELQASGTPVHSAKRSLKPIEVVPETAVKPAQSRAVVNKTDIIPRKNPILMSEKKAYTHPELGELVEKIFNSYKNEGSASRGTRNIAPNLFIGSEKQGYFNYSRSKNIILVYAYTGPKDYFPVIAREMYQYCADNNVELNIFTADQIESIGNIPFSATPFGVVSRIVNLQDFTLQGNKMRRLRYQVSKFENTGKCKTEEYRCGSNKETDQNIARIIDQWCAARTMVNPLIYIVREEILAGSLSSEHRLFLTYSSDVLQNAILISKLSSEENGYLMDLEFYPKDMPLGGLEFAIVKIIETLVAEGCNMFSMGGTYGCKLAPSSNADTELDKILDHLRDKNIFNDESNLQFKNKFRPENITIYLCRSVNCSPDNITDIIMMIADPSRLQSSDEKNHNYSNEVCQPATAVETTMQDDTQNVQASSLHTSSNEIFQETEKLGLVIEGETRSLILSEFGYNPLNIPHDQVEFDLKTDSWAQLEMPFIKNQIGHLHAHLQQPANLDESLRGIFPFTYFALTTSGRTAEHVFCKAWTKKGIVLQNLLFPTTIYHQIDKGFTPKEVPHPEIFQQKSNELYKGNLDWETLQKHVEQDFGSIAFVWIEADDNGAGGYPISIEHLKKVKTLLSQYSIPLVIDGTRIAENAQFLIEHEKEYAKKSIWEVVKDIFSYADAVTASLTKDFCVNKGGIIATNDENIFNKLQDSIREEGTGLDVIDKKVIALSLQNRKKIETQVLRRMEWVKLIWSALKKHGIPIVEPIGGHCVLIDVKQIPEFKYFKYPVPSFLAWLYLNTGIRAGAHSVGMQKNTSINDLVRLAIPVGFNREQIEVMIGRLIFLFERKENIPEIFIEGKQSESFGDVNSNYVLIKYHNVSGKVFPKTSVSFPAAEKDSDFKAPSVSDAIPDLKEAENGIVTIKKSHHPQDIAIVGMAGRYPKAKNLNELWENLVQGKDCIETIPDVRFNQRLHNEFTKKYRGGFIDDVDKFDSLFFNISPREAEIMDPQERLFLEVAWEAIEDAGYYPETLARENESRNIGVFVGAVWTMYQMIGVEEKLAGNNITPNSFLWSIANRLSYWMNLTGPSLTLDTACSSSLTAIYLACQAIHNGDCSAAIVGGVNLDLHQSKWDIDWAGGAGSLSKDGLCRSFGKSANGYVPGEGVGVFFLKPLDQAERDGDNIHGVIKSVVVNHGGRTSGFMVPSPHAETKLVQTALKKAKIDARSIGYIEAHATATELGDVIEISALTNAFQEYKVDRQSCPIGTIKTNIGHLEAASGVVGVQKALLQMKYRKLVPSLHSSELNEFIDFESSPFYVEQTVEEWKAKEVDGVRFPLRAGISAFGAGGTNAHIIIEQYEPLIQQHEYEAAGTGEKIFPLSARNEGQLRETAVRLRAFVQQDPSRQIPFMQQQLNDIAYTLQIGRKSFDCRLAVIAKTKEELVEKLTCFIEGKKDDTIMSGNVRNAESITRLLNRKEKEEFINLLSQSRDPRRLAQLWIDGLLIDWQSLQGRETGRRISLPTYPFAKERYWIETAKTGQRISAALNPLLRGNTSDRTNNSSIESAIQVEFQSSQTSVDTKHVISTEATKKFEFSLAKDNGAQPGNHFSLSVEEKAQLFVKQLFATRLKVSVDEVNVDCNLMDTGITSIDMAEMTLFIKEKIDRRFSPTAFFECTTLRSLSVLLSRTYESVFQKIAITKITIQDGKMPQALSSTQNQAIHANAPLEKNKSVLNKSSQDNESRKSASQEIKHELPQKPLHTQDAESDLPFPDLKNMSLGYDEELRFVLLTGATGFLGIHILSELLNSNQEIRAFCLVRATDKEHGLQRLRKKAAKYEVTVDESRIAVLCGDINKPRLGLDEAEWEFCCRELQQIIHTSARVNHIEGYATFRDSTQGMKEIIRLAGSCKLKLIHFMSSIAACARKIGEQVSFYEKEDFVKDGASVFGGYGQSKWVQETFLKRAHDNGIPYAIYRLGELSGSSQTGLGQTDDMLHRLLQMRLALGCKEKISNDVLDMLPVDFAAKLIVNTGKTPELWNKILHATHPRPYPMANVYRHAQEEGLHFDSVSRSHYLFQCYDYIGYASSINPIDGFVLECVLRDVEGSSRNLMMADGYFAVLFPFDQNNFKHSLKTTGLVMPEWKPLLNLYFKRWKRNESKFMARIHDYQKWSQLCKKQEKITLSQKASAIKHESVIEI